MVSKHSLTLLTALMLAGLWMPYSASAATVAVPSDYGTIQAAIDGVADGDTILISDTRNGAYRETLSIVAKTIHLRANESRYKTTIFGEDSVLDLAWPNGIQEELSQPVAVLLNESAETIAIASQGGFRCFTAVKEFQRYVQAEILVEEAQP